MDSRMRRSRGVTAGEVNPASRHQQVLRSESLGRWFFGVPRIQPRPISLCAGVTASATIGRMRSRLRRSWPIAAAMLALFALVYRHALAGRVHFGRDAMGFFLPDATFLHECL